MCEDCGGICAIFDRMIEDAIRASGRTVGFSEGYRSRFHSTNVKGITGADGPKDEASLHDLVEEAACIDMTPQELEAELSRRSGLGESISLWIREKRVPSGMVRKIILTNAEDIIREHGARPKHSVSMLEAA